MNISVNIIFGPHNYLGAKLLLTYFGTLNPFNAEATFIHSTSMQRFLKNI